MLLLKATEENWGLIGPGDWEKRSWKINFDGWYSYKTSFRSGTADIPEIPSLTEEGVLSADQMKQLLRLLDGEWSQEKVDGCDGVAWEFKMYDVNKTVIKHRECGYIWGVEPFESIVRLLPDEEEQNDDA